LLSACSHQGGGCQPCDDNGTFICLQGTIELDQASTTLHGSMEHDLFGYAMDAGGDAFRDGRLDIAVGAPLSSIEAWEGAVFVFHGPVGTGTVQARDADAEIWGAGREDMLGSAVAWVGDVTGDRRTDLLVGAACAGGHEETETVCWDTGGCEEETTWACGPGKAYLFPGPIAGEVALSEAILTVTGDADSAGLGADLGSIGDQDGDGVRELLMVASGDWRFEGDWARVGVFSGSLRGERALDEALAMVTELGASRIEEPTVARSVSDVNGDGVEDLAIGSRDESRLVVFEGPLSGTLGQDAATFGVGVSEGGRDGGALGASLAAGDVNGDGHVDLLAGAPRAGPWVEGGTGDCWWENGGAYLYLGPLQGQRTRAEADAVLQGSCEARSFLTGGAVATGDDLDKDGRDDLLVGDASADASADGPDTIGKVYLFYGPVSGGIPVHEADLIMTGTHAYDAAGTSLLMPGDLDGDGFGDLLVGAEQDNQSPVLEGRVYLVLGGPQ